MTRTYPSLSFFFTNIRNVSRHRRALRFGFLFLGLELVLEHYRSRCHALFREDRFDLVALPVPVAVLSARSLLPGAQQVQGHTVELAQLGQTGECFLFYRRLFILTSLSCANVI